MASKRRPSIALENSSKIARWEGYGSDQFDNTGLGSQHNNTGRGRQFIAQNIYMDDNRSVDEDMFMGRHYGEFDFLQDLGATDPRDEKIRIEETKGGLIVESYDWILYNDDFNRWRHDESSGLFWINGSPGKGKTMLLCGIVDALSRTAAETNLPAFFLCQHDDPRLNSAVEVLRGLIYVLAIRRQSLLKDLKKRYFTPINHLLKQPDPFRALSKILLDILATPTTEPVYLIVDALDECQQDLKKLLGFIRSTLSTTSACIKWIVTSRPVPEIQEALELVEQRGILNLDSIEASIYAAVNSFVDHKVSRLARLKKYKADLTESVRAYLRNNAQGTFLWVALVCESLTTIMPWETRSELQILEAFPVGLEPLYQTMMEMMLACNTGELVYCKSILAATIVIRRPLTLAELPSLVDLGDQIPTNTEWLMRIIEFCGSFLVVRQETIYFVHESAKAYLVRNAANELFTPNPSHVHHSIYSRSMQALSNTLGRDMYNLQHPGSSTLQIQPIHPDPLAAIGYSCVYWVDHLVAMNIGNQEYLTLLRGDSAISSFMQYSFLYWLEALSLMGKMTEGVIALTVLEKFLVEVLTRGECRLLDLVKDARRFILRNRGLIEDAPLQAYASALVFCPVNSLVRTFFKPEEPEWIEASPVVDENWSPCIQVLHGHRDMVNTVTYSDKYLASASIDNSLRIWDPATGKHLQTLSGHKDKVLSVAFSHIDNQYVASAAGDGTIKTWSAATGKCISTFQAHTRDVRSITFSHNGESIASASGDKCIKIWDASTCKNLKTLKGHDDEVNSVRFLYEDRLIISGSSDSTIKIWDVVAGTCEMTLEGHTERVKSICYSHDGKHIISASHDCTLRIWDLTGKCIMTLTGHTNWINSVAISSDDKHLASASNDRTVKIWDFITGKCIKTLKGYNDAVNSVAFSCDGKLLATAWIDRSIGIWDRETICEELTEEADSHTDWVNVVIFSPDCKHLASISDDFTIKLWDIAERKCVDTLEGHTDSINWIKFSYNSVYLASASSDRTIKLFDTTTKELRTIEGHSGGVASIAFSHNDLFLASVDDRSIRIWSVANGQCTKMLEGHTDRVTSIAFSSNDEYLASSSNDHTCRVWDLGKGCCTHILRNHSDCVSYVSFSFDGKYLASTSGDRTIIIWDAVSGKHIKTLSGHRDWVGSATFSHDSKHLASTSTDSTVRFWSIASGECLQCIHVEAPVNNISFNEADSQILTERGCIMLKSRNDAWNNDTGQQIWYGYGISSDKAWITYNGENVLWLPLEYRIMYSAVSGSLISIGCSSGKVLIIRCSKDIFPDLKGSSEYIPELSHDGMDYTRHASTLPVDNMAVDCGLYSLIMNSEGHGTKRQNIGELDPDGRTSLHLAVLCGNEQAVQQILNEGIVEPSMKDKNLRTALFYAVKKGERNISLLLARKQNVPDGVVVNHLENQSYEYKAQALYAAIKRKDEREVSFLIEIGADMEARGYGGRAGFRGTALHEAARHGTLDILKIMLENGADKHARDILDRTPSQRPIWSRTPEISELLS
ncbi:hypothetical protein F4806DRAFT_472225 [Annulohypoxylon nitens]|nr:hypothetical protein F4806DRAFT_472225 [Annulohypoxylon nitens]